MIKGLFTFALLLAATPALATGGFECRTTDGSDIALNGVTGHGIVTPLVGARLHVGDTLLTSQSDDATIAVAQSWIDGERLWLDLVDPQALRFEARLRATVKGHAATGTLVRDGRTHPVRCTVD